ncbi:MAG: hypothetical protein E7470_08655 [Ruminococcaceae bacterium]|nr:hypothetical protein [Oscillospiraceae bacterium]
MGSVRIDPFYYDQPPLLFVDELKKPLHEKKPTWFIERAPQDGEVAVQGAYLVNEFTDPELLLETAVADFNTFLHVYEMAGECYPIYLQYGKTPCFEAYTIEVQEDCCRITAADTEGIRRGLVYLEDELHRRSGPVLPLGVIERKPVIRHRITRGFYSPTTRPPKCADELMDDEDYYPDEYLNRLAHDGANGLWIYTLFENLLPSDIFVEYGENSARRIEKLKKVVAKCKRYGIKVWVFGVEPIALRPEMAKNYPDCTSEVDTWNGHHTVCPYSERGAQYCIEATQKLMTLVPDLAGIIDITFGERPTNCSSANYHKCPRCKDHTHGEIMARTIDLMKEGIRRSGTNGEFVSWTYGHRDSKPEDIREYVRLAPEDVILQENFEDAGFDEQLGKTRQAIDYWLSYKGPSQMFRTAAQTAVENRKRMFAKMQVCCSHELATVPYIPAPGILFDKYAAAYRYGVEGVMQCWLFGNYPSMMSKAAGELAFVSDFSDKHGFLTQLAGAFCGSDAQKLVAAWDHFEESYIHYPLNIMFSYYGPMHDGVVWDLALEPKDAALPRSWQLTDKPDGDRIGECLQCGHTLEEAVELTSIMRREWNAGVALLPENTPAEQASVANALATLYASGNNILRFYALRHALVYGEQDKQELLDEMERIVDAEIANSEQMIALCEQDSRLGYHSEAEGYKFFPKKLRVRVENLKVLKQTEFVRVRENVKAGETPLRWYLGEDGPGYQMAKGKAALEKAPYEPIADQDAAFRGAYDEDFLYIELKGAAETRFRMHFEYRLMWPSPGVIFERGEKRLSMWATTHQSIFGEKIQAELDKYQLLLNEPGHYLIAISRKAVGWEDHRPIRVMMAANDQSWIYDDEPVHLLGKNDISPGEFGWLRV